EYEDIPEDDFATTFLGEEIDLTLFPLALGPYEYEDIPEDDFATTFLGEEIDLTLFHLALGPYVMPYPFSDVRVVLPLNILSKKALDHTITPAKLRRTESLLPLQLSNRISVRTALLTSHGTELNSRYAALVASKSCLRENLKRNPDKIVRPAPSAPAPTTSPPSGESFGWTSASKGSEAAKLAPDLFTGELITRRGLVLSLPASEFDWFPPFTFMFYFVINLFVRSDTSSEEIKNLKVQLAEAEAGSKSQGYRDVDVAIEHCFNDLRSEVTRFVGSGIDCLVRRHLSNDEFNANLAHILTFSIT
nr:hypothetical protein [Tanacetum cinerariifolium]